MTKEATSWESVRESSGIWDEVARMAFTSQQRITKGTRVVWQLLAVKLRPGEIKECSS